LTQVRVKSCDTGRRSPRQRRHGDVEAIGLTGWQRRIRFVQGKPVAADAMGPVTAARQGDIAMLKVGATVRYDNPDTFLSGV
jgi:hypothetical protein